ncbi:MAG TPA: NUDIX domain-containing protein, partial [Aequorivita sp.]|nr:NUDIX domain-containing protein [Aequorivita sp.]
MNGVFPNNCKDLLKLKGVGDYTASAIASICFNKPEAVVDGNVYRVLSRFFGISTPINTTTGQKEFKQLAQELIEEEQPGTFNQAIMEFGARFCVPQNPDCVNCIFNASCEAFQLKKVASLPMKIKNKTVKIRFFNYLVFLSENDRTILQQRNGKGIWHKLFEFPLIETSEEINLSALKKLSLFQELTENMEIESISLFNSKPVLHKLSHQHLNTRFWIIETSEEMHAAIPISEVKNYAVPVLIGNFVSDFFENY